MHVRVVTTTLVVVVVDLRDCAGKLRFDRRRWLSVKCVFLLRVFLLFSRSTKDENILYKELAERR